jgi:hypothetical protein
LKFGAAPVMSLIVPSFQKGKAPLETHHCAGSNVKILAELYTVRNMSIFLPKLNYAIN